MRLLPPADLLQGVAGVEAGLRDNKKLGWLSTIGVVVSVTQLVLDKWLNITDSGAGSWWGPVAVLLLVSSVLLYLRSRVWIRESSRPFRYTCSLDHFVALGEPDQRKFPGLAGWMKFDLAKLLNDRLGRLSFLDTPVKATGDPGQSSTEHIHISGEFVVRAKREKGKRDGAKQKEWELEVAPRVRVGGEGRPATLAHSLPYVLSTLKDPSQEVLLPSGEEGGPVLTPGDYETILERTYYSLASEIYRQIRSDVQEKIDLLPTKHLQATAYLREADDYAKSNTLYGLESAIKLYRSAIELFDPWWCRRPAEGVRRRLHNLSRWWRERKKALRVRIARVRPAMANVEIKTANAEIGYANALLYRRTLAGLSGRRMNPIYEARKVAERAVERLEKLPGDDPAAMQARFHAYVCLALAWHHVDCPDKAQENLDKAHGVFPAAYEDDARYLYVQGLVEEQPSSALRFLRLAIEQEPRFEVAQFEHAYTAEMLWRTRKVLEGSVAEHILDEYDQILKLNPANVAAWAHGAYIHWLCGRLDKARAYYDRGRAFREKQRDGAMAQLEYGLARIAAEEGDFKEAYGHYVNASSGQLRAGVSGWKSTSAQYYFFESLSPAMLMRYEDYKTKADGRLTVVSDDASEARVREIVRSFVLNDYGEACHTYYLRYYDVARRQEAQLSYEEAKTLNEEATLPYYNLHLLHLFGGRSEDHEKVDEYERNFQAAITELEQLLRYEPRWADAMLARLAAPAEAASKEWSRRVAYCCAREEAARMAGWQPVGNGGRSSSAPSVLTAQQEDAVRHLRALLPQGWLWDGNSGSGSPACGPVFDWKKFQQLEKDDPVHWERQFDDLQVEALFEWALIQLATVERGGGTERGDNVRRLLELIRSHFWPGDFRVLFASYQLDRDDRSSRDRVRQLMHGWLCTKPPAYWALEVATTEFFDLEGRPLTLFAANEQLHLLDEAIDDIGASPSQEALLEWAKQRRSRIAATVHGSS